MKRTIGIYTLCILSVAGQAFAQAGMTGPVKTTDRFEWDMPANVVAVADAQTFTPRLRDTLLGVTVAELAPFTCTLSVSVVRCVSAVTQGVADMLNGRVGKHDLTLSVFRSDIGDSQTSLPFALITPVAGAPINFRITRAATP